MNINSIDRTVNHIVLLSSAYSLKKRIALHYFDEFNISKDFFTQIQKDMDKIKDVCGKDLTLGSHCFKTDSISWQSVIDNDCYFEGVKVIDSIDTFIDLIQQGRTTDGLTIARYILSKVECTHLKLQKLVYFCYADYMVATKDRLFEDNIFAYKYGPVIESVYSKYKGSNRQLLGDYEDNTNSINNTQDIHLPLRSRIMFTVNGISKAISIDKTLDKYCSYSAKQLVELTHKVGSPWDMTNSKSFNNIISDETILKYYKI